MNNVTKQRTAKGADTVFAQEKKFLQPTRIMMDVGVTKTSKDDKYSLIYVKSNYYSVPDYLFGNELMLKSIQ
ncbi:hypothetical protein [Haloplasma contractile]|uniref:hypothetical protein n=1 Tax=Haloplasma contractile TaxID=471825 RepID=UPI0012685536|nr:hypothetical protein [Haloplasma contractile]